MRFVDCLSILVHLPVRKLKGYHSDMTFQLKIPSQEIFYHYHQLVIS